MLFFNNFFCDGLLLGMIRLYKVGEMVVLFFEFFIVCNVYCYGLIFDLCVYLIFFFFCGCYKFIKKNVENVLGRDVI